MTEHLFPESGDMELGFSICAKSQVMNRIFAANRSIAIRSSSDPVCISITDSVWTLKMLPSNLFHFERARVLQVRGGVITWSHYWTKERKNKCSIKKAKHLMTILPAHLRGCTRSDLEVEGLTRYYSHRGLACEALGLSTRPLCHPLLTQGLIFLRWRSD